MRDERKLWSPPADLLKAIEEGRASLREYRRRRLVTDMLAEIGEPSVEKVLVHE